MKPTPSWTARWLNGLWSQVAVEAPRAQVGDHVRRRDGANGDVPVGIEPVIGEVAAEQQVLHRVLERTPSFIPFHCFGSRLFLCLR